jgi:phytol kinase
MTWALPRLAEHTWAAIGIALTAFLLLLFGARTLARTSRATPESARKLLHTGSGLFTLAFPFLFRDVWPVLLLTGGSALFVAMVRFLPALRRRGGTATDVGRATFGEFYFPAAVAFLFWMTLGAQPLLFVIPVLVLTLADATCALIGVRYGRTRFVGASKSLEGSIAFVVVAFFCIHVPLLLWSDVGRLESLLIAATLALLVMLLEGSAWRGLDNLFIPIGGYFLLRAYLALDAAALAPRLLVTAALVLMIVLYRRRTTLGDDSLLAGAFLCYLAWALMGWRWLVAPISVFVGYTWLSPGTADNSRRMHDAPVLLSVWAGALVWLALAHVAAQPTLLLPYAVVFAAHLSMFGISRLAHQFPDRPLGPLFWRAVATSWVVVMVPFVAVTGVEPASVAAATGAGAAMAAGTAAFVRTQPHIRHAPQSLQRWVLQAGAACATSMASWLILIGVRRVL